jgi:acetyltransferase-like isoleucine patch superfamily enzyme
MAGIPEARGLTVESKNKPVLLESGIKDVAFGTNVTVVQPANLYGCAIGNDCFIGPFVEIQKDVTIGPRTRIQSHSFVCELVTIGADCVVAHGVMFINDTFSTGGPARGDKTKWKSTTIGNHVSIGSNATILPVTICDHVLIGAGSVVTRDITEPGIYAGNPARKR